MRFFCELESAMVGTAGRSEAAMPPVAAATALEATSRDVPVSVDAAGGLGAVQDWKRANAPSKLLT